jgi:hypothetical protein
MPKRDTSEILEEINSKLDKILTLVACQGKDLDTQIKILAGSGLSYKEIGGFVGMSGDAVGMRLSRARRARRRVRSRKVKH